jgi:hypothetical protein
MSFFESIPLAEQQSSICHELASDLKQKLIQSRNYGWVRKEYLLEDGSFEFEGKEFGGKHRWYLLFPFSSQVGKNDERFKWVVGLEENEDESYSFEDSSVKLYEVPIGSSGNLNFQGRDDRYSIHDDSIFSADIVDRHLRSRSVPRLPSGSVDVQEFGAPDAENLTYLRILLEDALSQLASSQVFRVDNWVKGECNQN